MTKAKGYTAVFSGVMMFVFLLVFTNDFGTGFSEGLIKCAEIVIPSLFPFLIAASLSGSGKIPSKISRFISPITNFLFGLPAETIFAVVLGQLGGYLSGAKSAQSLCSTGEISESQAEKLMFFCINPGIGFAINAVGSIMLSSRNSGRIIFASICISGIICGMICRFLTCNTDCKKKNNIALPSFSEAIVNSVSSGVLSLFTACAFVCLFSGVVAVIEAHISNENIKLAGICLLEITNGCFYASDELSLPLISAICAFGGLCVHMQIFAVADNFRIRLPLFYFFRILHSVLAFLVCSFILRMFPAEIQTMVNITPEAQLWSFSAPASISMLFLSALLILDLDNKRKI